MFDKLLIANRGEIACRVIDTCRRMGVATVAVYSDTDRGARHVAMADEAVALGGDSPADSYLRGDAIIAAAQATGAAAIHPGYGFLSENADFAEAVAAAGLIFVGPGPEAIGLMARKDAAKAAMAAAGVPVVPGTRGAEDLSDADLARDASRIGFPLLIKAVAGGGGKGLRRVDRAEDFPAALARARSEAAAAFGTGAVLLEKLISPARHVEVQVFGDGHDTVHLFDRDCSLQRRHQKVIEEAPAPGLSPQMRAAMTATAVRAAQAVGYVGAGTVEFIVDARADAADDGFWFMEMNTRLQVEHPVTEAITGLDLVEWQIRVAAGARLPLTQAQIDASGHAVEARLYAEDVTAGYLPAAGRLAHLRWPDGVRVDTGVGPGDDVPPHYDPMIAKLIATGPTRAAALDHLDRALADTQVAGVPTNRGLLRSVLADPVFRAGGVDTGWLERQPMGANPPPPEWARALAALAVLEVQDHGPDLENFALWQPLKWHLTLDFAGEEVCVSVTGVTADRYVVELPGTAVTCLRTSRGWAMDGVVRNAASVAVGDQVWVCAAETHLFQHRAPGDIAPGSDRNATDLRAPMPGRVTEVFVAVGDEVAAGAPLAVLEAMKMEQSLCAPRAGTVAAVHVVTGAQVDAGTLLIALAPAEPVEAA